VGHRRRDPQERRQSAWHDVVVPSPRPEDAKAGDLSAIHTWLWNGTGAVPSPEDLSLDRDGDGSPFQVLAVLTF